jgi:hypothetical protein
MMFTILDYSSVDHMNMVRQDTTPGKTSVNEALKTQLRDKGAWSDHITPIDAITYFA